MPQRFSDRKERKGEKKRRMERSTVKYGKHTDRKERKKERKKER